MSDGSVRDWSRERWRKLYLVESLHKNSWPLMARALEAYLVKRARDDGFLARTPDELLSALNPTSIERGDTQEAIHVLLDDGFLDVRPEGVFVANLPAAQGDAPSPAERPATAPKPAPTGRRGGWADKSPEERSAAAKRAAQARWGKAADAGRPEPVRRMRNASATHEPTHLDASSDASGQRIGDASAARAVSGQDNLTDKVSKPDEPDSQSDERSPRDACATHAGDASHDAPRRIEETDASDASAPSSHARARFWCLDDALALPVRERAQRLLDEPHLAQWVEPHRWPELVDFATRISAALGWHSPRLTSASPTVMRLVDVLASFTAAELERAIKAAPSDTWLTTGRKGLGSLTGEVVGRLLNPKRQKADPEQAPQGVDPRVEAARLAAERRREESRRRAREALWGAQATLGAPPPQKRATGAATAEQSLSSVAAADQGVGS